MKSKIFTLLAVLMLTSALFHASAAAGDTFEVPMGIDGLKAGSYGTDANKAAYYTFTDNGDGTCTLTRAAYNTSGVLASNLRNGFALNIPATANGLTVTAIGNDAFYQSSKFTSITFPESVKTLGDDNFKGCAILTTLNLGGIETIGNRCFYYSGENYQTKLTDVDLSNVKSIGSNSFTNFPNLSNITLSPELENLGTGSFSGCPEAELSFPEDSRYMVIDGIIYECEVAGGDPASLLMVQPNYNGTTVTIPATVTAISSRAFQGNTTLQSIDLANVKSIGNYAFMGCSSLATATGSASLQTLGTSAFSGCTSLQSFELGAECTPENLAKVFSGCTGLQSFTVAEGNPSYSAADGVVFNADGTTLIAYMCDNKAEYSVPSGVTTIAKGAFNNAKNTLTSLTLGNDVTTIDEDLFEYGSGSSVENLTIGAKVSSIGATAFYECNNIGIVNCEAVIPPAIPNQWVFSYNTVNNAELKVPAGSEDAYKAANGWNTFADRITTGIEGIEVEATDSGDYYDLRGMRADAPRAGQIYIHNGKKIIYR